MNRVILLFFVLSGFMNITMLQAQTVISGRVLGPDNELLPYANVLLFQHLDTTFLKGSVTDEEGNFYLQYIPDSTRVSKNHLYY